MSAEKSRDNLERWHKTGCIDGKALRGARSNSEGIPLEFKELLPFPPYLPILHLPMPIEDLSNSLRTKGSKCLPFKYSNFEAQRNNCYLPKRRVHQFCVLIVYKLNLAFIHFLVKDLVECYMFR